MASGADQEDLERKFRDYMQSFAEKGHLACPVCGELAWEYDSSSLATANRIALRCIHHDGLAPNHPPGSKSNGRRPLDRALSHFFARAFQVSNMPRPRKSDVEKAARGTLQKCRMNGRTIPVAKDRLSEEPPVGVPGDAKEAWALAVKNAPEGRLSVVDGPALEQWCRTYALWRKMAKAVEHGALYDVDEKSGARKLSPEFTAMQALLASLIKLEKELGFTPVARAHAPADASPEKDEDFADFTS